MPKNQDDTKVQSQVMHAARCPPYPSTPFAGNQVAGKSRLKGMHHPIWVVCSLFSRLLEPFLGGGIGEGAQGWLAGATFEDFGGGGEGRGGEGSLESLPALWRSRVGVPAPINGNTGQLVSG
jgi:hypothetical protein